MNSRENAPLHVALVPILLMAGAASADPRAIVDSQAIVDPQAIVEECRQAASNAARIACLERALTGPETESGEKLAPDSESRPESQPDSRPAPELPPEPVASPPATSAAKPATSMPASKAGKPAATDPAQPELGAEQVRARSETGADREARLASAAGLKVAAYGEVPYRRLTVELENGQVWQQIKGDTQTIRVDLDRNQTVDIEESTLGGYKLRLNEMRRTIRVERIR